MPPTIVHFETDTLPRVVVTGPAGSGLDLMLPFRIEVGDAAVEVVSWGLAVQVGDEEWSPSVRTRCLPPGLATQLKDRMDRSGAFSFTHLPYYAALDDAGIVARRLVYVEGCVPRVPEGAQVRYRLSVTTSGGGGSPQTVDGPWYVTRALDPRFTREEVRRTFIPAAGRAPDAYVLLHRRDDQLDRFRIDVLDLGFDGRPERANLVVKIGDEPDPVVDLGAVPRSGGPEDEIVVPLVDIAADSVTFAVPRGAALPTVTVVHRDVSDTVDLATPPPVGEVRVMFVNFAIQGLNDLFANPDDDYSPPRTYLQLTMRDEKADYSSRPGAPENGEGDGYAFTIDAHRRYGVPQLWAMNGGLLGLLAHDDRADLAAIAADVEAGVLEPVVAGYGAHRLPYYSRDTNRDAVDFGAQVLQNVVGYRRRIRRVYYPDSRITSERTEVTGALQDAGVEFLVVDAGVDGQGRPDTNTVVDARGLFEHDQKGRYVDYQYLWRDENTGAYLLFIDRETKDSLLGATPDEADRGTMARNLRRKLVEFATLVDERAGNLVVYSDDADKASGNGWFDGSTGSNQRYQAVLAWVAAHPWVRAVTTADLWPVDGPAPEVIGTLRLTRASDPYIHDNWWLDVALEPDHDNGLVFDTWYAAWARTRADWLGENLRAISDRAQGAIRRRRDDAGRDDEMITLARLYFLMCLHESQWSKRPRIDVPPGQPPPHEGDPAARPEDFVVAESLQLRNTHVYLNASIWAAWAATVVSEAPPQAYRNGGDVIDGVSALEEKSLGAPPPWLADGQLGLHWDHDPLRTVVLYNQHALVVIDRNGGRITHLFVMVGERPVSVSGTHKAYQSLEYDWTSFAGLQCDGLVLQNTVCTPNHAYVACDVEASGVTVGESPTSGEVYAWAYPDNFNEYEVADDSATSEAARTAEVTLIYGEPTAERPPVTIAGLADMLQADRDARPAGKPGIVLHDLDAFGAFRKTIRLEERTVHVEYHATSRGHRVANEFCVDLLAAALHGRPQTCTVEDDHATVTNEDGLEVRVVLGSRCAFTEAPGGPAGPPTAPAQRLHRVMTDNLEIVAPEGGDFAYRIVLPG